MIPVIKKVFYSAYIVYVIESTYEDRLSIINTKMDNIYKEGALITAKSDPQSILIIKRYKKRIYYCQKMDDPSGKLLAYFERELAPLPEIKNPLHNTPEQLLIAKE